MDVSKFLYDFCIQGKAVVTFLDAILDKTLRSTVALLAARGRGKSAALGLSIAGAVAVGYCSIRHRYIYLDSYNKFFINLQENYL